MPLNRIFRKQKLYLGGPLAIKERILSSTHPELQAIKANLDKVLSMSGQRKKP